MAEAILANKQQYDKINPIARVNQLQIHWNMDTLCKILLVLFSASIPISTSASSILLISVFITFVLSGIVSKDFRQKIQLIKGNPIATLSIAFFALFVLGIFHYHNDVSWNDKVNTLWKMSKLLFIPLFFPLLIEERWRRSVLGAFLFSMLLTLGLSYCKLYLGFGINSRYTAACVFKNHIDTNLMMSFAAFFIAHYMLFHVQAKIRLFAVALIGLLTFYILWMSEGRSGYIIFTVLWLVFCLQRLPWLAWKSIMIGLLTLAILFSGVNFFSARFQSRLNEAIQDTAQYQVGQKDTSLGLRLEFLTESWQLVKDHLWFGVGTGSFKSVYGEHVKQNIHNKQHKLNPTNNPHNEYMNILFQLGLIGLLSFCAFLFGMFKASRELPLPERYLAQGLVVGMSVGFLGNSWLMDVTSGYFFVIIAAITFAALPQRNQNA